MKCDFCSLPKPTWKYPCTDFVLEGTPLGSDGAWAACDECAALIEHGDREGLAKRSLDHYDMLEYVGRGRARRLLAKIHRHFFRHRDGSVERIG